MGFMQGENFFENAKSTLPCTLSKETTIQLNTEVKKMDLKKLLIEITKNVDMQHDELIEFVQNPGSDDLIEKLCVVAIETMDNEVRCAILDLLKTQFVKKASDLFADYAANGTDRQRKWAFVNLSLIECGTKRDHILKGLKDPVASVRRSAALNVGLYHDDVFVSGIVDYFENQRRDLLRELVIRASEKVIQRLRKLKAS
jgi:hypothetical protein